MDFFSKTGMGFYPSPFTFSPEMPINTGNLRMNGKSLPFITLHHPSSFLRKRLRVYTIVAFSFVRTFAP